MTTATITPTRTITQTAHDMVLLRNPAPTIRPVPKQLKADLAKWTDPIRRGLHMTYRVLKFWYV